MVRRRTLLITGAAAALAPLLNRPAWAAASVLLPLKPGARIRAVNPGTWMDPDRDLDRLVGRCAAQGWRLEIPDSVMRQWRYFSATDHNRVSEMESAWRDPSVDSVFYLGGGWGAARVLEAGFRFPARAKWSFGFSDSSSLLLAQQAAGLPGAVHGSFGGTDAQWQRTVQLLRGAPVAPLRGDGLRPGIARGPLLVTNLTVATHLIGTPWLPSFRGAVLVLEDVGEEPYRIDRMLTQWRSAGLLQQLAGVACGALLGRFPCETRRRPLLVALLAVGALALGGLHAATARPPCRPLDAFGGAALAGAATIGFVGPALAEAAASAGPDSTVMAGGIVEWWIQVLGAVVTQAATRRNGFAVCACAQAVAALLLAGALLCRRPPEE